MVVKTLQLKRSDSLTPIHVLCVFGTRPEAIKMAPLVNEIKQHPELSGSVCVTGQHREMLDQVMCAFGITADYDLNIMKPGQSLSSITADVLADLRSVLADSKPDIVLVHGDTTTSFAAALSAFYQQIPVGHIEAGLRTFNPYSPFPEEMNRTLTSKLATLHFAPTAVNRDNLARESITRHVFVTGNTVIDALLSLVYPDYSFHSPELQKIRFDSSRSILLTAHRRENFDQPFQQIFTAVRKIADFYPDVQFLYPVHRNPSVRDAAQQNLSGHPRIHLLDPLDVADMHNLINRCYLVMTDSGGLQEEAPALGKPVLVLRTETERPEAVAMGTVKVSGIEADDIFRDAALLLDDAVAYQTMSRAVNPYGDGLASRRICEHIIRFFLPSV